MVGTKGGESLDSWIIKKDGKYLSIKINYDTLKGEEGWSKNIEFASCFNHRHEAIIVMEKVGGEIVRLSEERERLRKEA